MYSDDEFYEDEYSGYGGHTGDPVQVVKSSQSIIITSTYHNNKYSLLDFPNVI